MRGISLCRSCKMIAVASFCLGVYVGEHGWTRRGLTLAGPGALPQPRGGLAMPGGPPNLQGVGQGMARESITLRTPPQGPRTVLVNEETRVKRDDEEARLADLRRGVGVAVFGDFRDQGRTLVARLIVILPPPRR